jgi:hypothetical protein
MDAGVVCGSELVSCNPVAEDLGQRLELGASRKRRGPGESAAGCQGGKPVGCEEQLMGVSKRS